jgi:hypothetical protein
MLEDFTDSNRPNKERLPRVFDVMGWNGFKSGEIGDEDFRIVQRNSDDLLLLGGRRFDFAKLHGWQDLSQGCRGRPGSERAKELKGFFSSWGNEGKPWRIFYQLAPILARPSATERNLINRSPDFFGKISDQFGPK